jgi:hypothetical protein
LPHIERELNKLLERTNDDLEDLPPPPSSAPMREVFRLITEFTRAVERQGEGIPGREGLLQQIRSPQEKFRVAIRKTAPFLVPQFRKGPIREESSSVGSVQCEEELYDGRVGPASSLAPAHRPFEASPLTRPVSVDEPAVSEVGTHSIRPPFLVGEEHYDDIGLSDVESIFIDDVLETAEWCVPMYMQYQCLFSLIANPLIRAVTRELPNNYPFIVQKKYILAYVKKWDDPAQNLFVATVRTLKELTLHIVETHFGQYTHSHLKQRVS